MHQYRSDSRTPGHASKPEKFREGTEARVGDGFTHGTHRWVPSHPLLTAEGVILLWSEACVATVPPNRRAIATTPSNIHAHDAISR
jgi:hypothetical protein